MVNDYLGQMGLALNLNYPPFHCWPRTEIISSHVSMCREGWPAFLSWANFSVLSLSTSAYTEGWVSIWGSDSDDEILIFPSYVVVQSLSPWDPMDCRTPGFPVLHFLEFTEIHVHWVGYAIQPSHLLSPLCSCPQSFLVSRSFPMIQLFISDGWSIGASASTSVLPMNIQSWFPLGLTGLISLLSRGLSRVFSRTIVWKHQFFGMQPSLWSNLWGWVPYKLLIWSWGQKSSYVIIYVTDFVHISGVWLGSVWVDTSLPNYVIWEWASGSFPKWNVIYISSLWLLRG